ncbi:MAG: hypothetical protein IMZ52_01715 [Actinobacteria bacterium]|nr:hypothetical protein [Actinomycetota bacterium]MBE3122889.1 hypothetical protein [Thermoplasmata archaeon]
MNKKILCILVCMLMISCAMTTIINTNNVKGEENPPELNASNPLNMTYIWDWTQRLADVTYSAYNDTEIPRGRSFGSKGGEYTKELLKNELDDFYLDDVHTEQLGYINGERKYSDIINVTDFQLTISSSHTYSYENPVPKKEMFAIPTNNNHKYLTNYWTEYFEFDDVSIVPNDMTALWPFAGTYNDYHFNVPNYEYLSDHQAFFAGNVSYLVSDDPVPTPDDQCGNVYLLDDVSSSQDKLDNLTDAEAAIIVKSGERGIQYIDASNCAFSVVSVNGSSGDDVKELLDDDMMFVDNAGNDGDNLTFTYNLDEGYWPDSPHVYIDRIPNHFELWANYNFFFRFVILGSVCKSLNRHLESKKFF